MADEVEPYDARSEVLQGLVELEFVLDVRLKHRCTAECAFEFRSTPGERFYGVVARKHADTEKLLRALVQPVVVMTLGRESFLAHGMAPCALHVLGTEA